MGKKRLFVSLLIIVLCLVFVTGCTDKLDFDKNEYVDVNEYSDQEMQVESEQTEEYPISKAISYSDGLAWVSYSDSVGEVKYSLVDKNGEEIYTIPEYSVFDPLSITLTEKGLCYYIYDDPGTKMYNLLNKNGEVVASTANGDFDIVVACGDEYAVVYKMESGLNELSYNIATMDENGNFITEYVALDERPLWSFDSQYDYARYLGDGMFLLKLYTGYAYYDCLNGNISYVDKADSIYDFQYSDGYLFPKNANLFSGDGFALFRDGTSESLGEYDYCTQGHIVYDKTEYLEVVRYSDKKKFEIDAYTDSPMSLEMYGDYGVLTMTGMDSNRYFTMVDNNLNPLFEPIKASSTIYCSDGYALYSEGEQTYVLDSTGAVVSEFVGDGSLMEFSDEVARFTYGFVDISGNPIITSVKLK